MNLSSVSHQIKFIIFKKVLLKSKFTQLQCYIYIYHMANFDRICLQLNTSRFQGNFETRGIFKTRGYFKQKLSKKMQYLVDPSIIVNLSFFKSDINSELLAVIGQYFQDFHISLIPVKICHKLVSCVNCCGQRPQYIFLIFTTICLICFE